LKKASGEKKHKTVASILAIVNDDRDLVFWAFVCWEPEEVCQLFPQLTRVEMNKLRNGLKDSEVRDLNTSCMIPSLFGEYDGTFTLYLYMHIELFQIRRLLEMCLGGNKLIGSDIGPDLKSLGIEHTNVEDLQDFSFEHVPAQNNPFRTVPTPFKLKDLARHYFGESDFQCGQHSAIADARMTRDLYRKKQELMQTQPIFTDRIKRFPPSPYVFDPNDRCTCAKK
jgi:hypothetical protein